MVVLLLMSLNFVTEICRNFMHFFHAEYGLALKVL